jgi:hypothetical protein
MREKAAVQQHVRSIGVERAEGRFVVEADHVIHIGRHDVSEALILEVRGETEKSIHIVIVQHAGWVYIPVGHFDRFRSCVIHAAHLPKSQAEWLCANQRNFSLLEQYSTFSLRTS